MAIHSTACIAEGVVIDPSNEIGAGVVIESGVTLGQDNTICPNAFIGSGTTIGDGNEIHVGAVIGNSPQDLTYGGEQTYVRIGNGNSLREYVTIHRASRPGGETVVGDNCLIMVGSHIAHDCTIGNDVTMANGCHLGGHVTVGSGAFLSGATFVHQFCRIGRLVMFGALGMAVKDLPPFMMCVGNRARVHGVNIVGLRRAGFGPVLRREIQDAYRVLYRDGLTMSEAVELLSRSTVPEVLELVRFIQDSARGVATQAAEGRPLDRVSGG